MTDEDTVTNEDGRGVGIRCHRGDLFPDPKPIYCLKEECSLWSTKWEACGDLCAAEASVSLAQSAITISRALTDIEKPLSAIAYTFNPRGFGLRKKPKPEETTAVEEKLPMETTDLEV